MLVIFDFVPGSYCCIARNCMGEAKSTAELTIEDIQNQLNEEERLQLLSTNQPPIFIKGLRSCEARINEDFRFTVQGNCMRNLIYYLNLPLGTYYYEWTTITSLLRYNFLESIKVIAKNHFAVNSVWLSKFLTRFDTCIIRAVKSKIVIDNKFHVKSKSITKPTSTY